ncbi:hypothetical protein HY379_02830 [Candidatus Saccharibacteria bacterium]|nr:hypothetical protein [Candidatus Saccharibacteria bacterium]
MEYEQHYAAKPKRAGRFFDKIKKLSWKGWLVIVIILALLAGGGWLAYDYSQVRKENDRLADPQVAAQEASARLIADVGKLAQLPQGETPTIATVSDVSKLQSQAFFAKAQNGDKVLIYTQAKKAYLYRPSTNKIIEIAPINLGNNNQNTSNSSNNTNNNP